MCVAPIQSHFETEADVKPIASQNIVYIFNAFNNSADEHSKIKLRDNADSKTNLKLLLSSLNQFQSE